MNKKVILIGVGLVLILFGLLYFNAFPKLFVIKNDTEKNINESVTEVESSEVNPLALKNEDFQLAGLMLNDPMTKIVHTLGEPLKKTSRFIDKMYDIPINMTIETWIYQDIEVGIKLKEDLKDGNLWSILTSSDKYFTYRGIKVGDSLDNVFSKYGKTSAYEDHYSYQGELESIEFKVGNDKVTGINIHQFFD